ncbi:MAG: GPR endopeptidase, partial [Oscillospiraceae bacterium]
ADSLGPKALTGLFVTGHLPQATINELSLRRLYAFSCGVQAASGINTNELLQQMVQLIKPTCVICIDSLCAKSATRLGNCVQISTNGLCSLGKEPINMELLGVPVIGLGVPTVMRLAEDPTLSITPKDINIIIKRASSLLALGINCAVQKSLSLQEICLLTS